MAVYNVDKISNWYDDFTNLKNKFNNTYYSDYKSCYIRTCTDDAVQKMKNQLNEYYSKIQKIYNKINNSWKEYLTDLKNTDNRLAGGKGSINASSVSSKISKLPTLQDYKRSLDVRIKSISGVIGTAKALEWSEDRTAGQNLGYFGERCAATVATAGCAIVEGLTKLVEDAGDLLVLAGAVVASDFTVFVDEVSYIASKVTGDESLKTNYTKQLWEDTRAFVSIDYTKQAFDSFYDNTSAGNWIKEKAYGFDTVREVGAEMGEVIGVIALSTVTGGSAAVLYGAAKAAEHTEENWQDENTSTAGGLVKGILQGTGEGIFFALGSKGDKLAQSAAKKAVDSGGKTILKKTGILGSKMIFEGGCSIAQDCFNILINTVFSNNSIIGENGETIKFNNFTEKWDYYYNEAGGTKGLMTSVATASILSGLSDSFDIYKVKGSNAVVKNADIDIDANLIGKNSSDINVKSVENNVKSYGNIKTIELSKEYDDLLKKSKEDWFISAKEARDNGWAWKLNDIKEVDDIVKRMEELEGALGIKNTGVPKSNIYDYSQAKKEADELARKISKEPIPNMEKYKVDTNSDTYKNAMRDIYANPSPTGKQVLSDLNNPFKNTNAELTLDDLKYNKSKTSKYTSEYLKSNIRKYSYTDTNLVNGLNDSIKSNGLYHFTSHCDEILDSGYIKQTGMINSYGTPKTFFFNGTPSVGQLATNLDDIPLKATAVKVIPTDDVISSSKLKVRSLDDGAISFDGKFDLSSSKTSKEYFCLFKENDELVYKKVTKDFYDSYSDTIEGKTIQDFLSNKKNIQAIKTDYLSEISGNFAQSRKTAKNVSKTTDSLLKADSNSIKNVDTYKKIWFDSANGKTTIEITDDLDPNIIFNHAAYPENVTIKKGNLEFYSDGYIINARVASKNMDDLSLNKTYFDNSDFFQKRGISYEQYAANNGIQLANYSNELDLATDLGDENWYLVNVLKNNMRNMTSQQYSMVDSAIKKPRCDLDSQELLNLAKPYLNNNDKINLNKIAKNPNMQNLTVQERHTLFQYQRAGGCEINGMLRGKDYSNNGINSFYDLETIMQKPDGGYGPGGIANFNHPRTIDKKHTIVEQIDDIINNHSNTNTIKGVSYLNSVGDNVPTKQVMDIIDQYGPSSPEALQAVQNLVGLDITDKAFNSKTIPPNKATNYSDRFYNHKRGEIKSLDLKVESYISPGCGAYIDTCGSSENGLGELLVKRNCTQKIIDAYIDPNTSKLVLVTLYT